MSYARLGTNCDTSARILIDNTKFFPLNSEIYKKFWVKMQEYPAEEHNFYRTINNIDRPEELKTKPITEDFTYQKMKPCCGRK